jgi:glucose/arabinose dehydrogenase
VGGPRTAVAALAAVVALALAGSASARTASFGQILSGFDSPVYVTSAPGDPATLYVVEKTGAIKIVRNGAVAGTFLDLHGRVSGGEEQGLLSVAFHPQYASNHLFYVDYTDTNGDTHVVEYKASNGAAIPGSARQLLFVDQPYENHNGGQLQFDRHGFLYVGMGDGGSGGDPGNRAQNLQSRLGKLLRINPTRKGSTWRIVGFGLRNPWRFSFDRANGNLWIGDVGQGSWEEVDYRSAAKVGRLANYGWSHFEGKAVYDAAKPYVRKGDSVSPVVVYSHGGGNCSITGGYVYRGSAVPSDQGRYFYGDFCTGTVWSFKAGNGRLSAPRVEGKVPDLSSFGEDGNGRLYATSLSGSLYGLGP